MANIPSPAQAAAIPTSTAASQIQSQLQPQKYTDVAKNYFEKLRYAGRRPSAQPRRPDNDLLFANNYR